jgi:polyhydroxyalkanoate synthesis regulator phasin
MAARAHEISQEAGSRVAAAMKELIHTAAGFAGFAAESARDLVQFMVRRGQMTQEEADKLMKEVESSHPRKPRETAPRGKPAPGAQPARQEQPRRRESATARKTSPQASKPAKAAPAGKPTRAKPVAKARAKAKPAAKKSAKPPAKKK